MNTKAGLLILYVDEFVVQLVQNRSIRRAKIILVDLAHGDSADVIVLQLLGHAFPDGGVKQGQVYRQVGVFMGHIHEYFAYVQCNGQFLPALPDESLLFCLTRLHLTAHELLQKAPGLVGRALADHEFVLASNQSCYYFGHLCHLPSCYLPL